MKKNREMRCKMKKKMGRRDQDKKNGETRCETKNKLGDEMRDEKKMGR